MKTFIVRGKVVSHIKADTIMQAIIIAVEERGFTAEEIIEVKQLD